MQDTTRISFEEAAHRLRMTVRLLKWFERHAAKSDDVKLRFSDGTISVTELNEFDQHLRNPWTKRYVPQGISDELKREAKGCCPLCRNPNDRLEEAHIDRKGKETDHYIQHPHNLVLLCCQCHDRYDNVGQQITNDVVKHAKEQLRNRLLEDIDRDIRVANSIKEVLLGPNMAVEVARLLASAIPDLASVLTSQRHPPEQTLHLATPLLTDEFPISHAQTAATLRAGADRAPDAGEVWEYVEEYMPQSFECGRGDGSFAVLEDWHCAECGEEDSVGEEPESVNVDPATGIIDVFLAFDNEHSAPALECSTCHTNEHLEYNWSSYCSYCQHQWDKLQDD